MRYWKRWIADIQAKTAALTLLERGAYTELLDHYYIEGKPITGDHGSLYRICRAFDKDERTAIDKVLGMYFTKTEAGLYMNRRAQEEIEHAEKYSEEQTQRGWLGVEARWGKKKRAPAQANGYKIEFDAENGIFVGIDEDQELQWQNAFPAAIVPEEIQKAAAWLKANPANRKKNNARFIVNWLTRVQEKAPRIK